MIQRITHVGHVVRNIDKAIELYAGPLGFARLSDRVTQIPGGRAFMVGVGDQSVEIIQPTDSEHRVGRFLQRHGEGWFHLSFRTDDIAAQVRLLRDAGIAAEDPRQLQAGWFGTKDRLCRPSFGLRGGHRAERRVETIQVIR